MTPINKWLASERPREKLLKEGPASLSDAELLAIFIRSGLKGQTALDISHELFIQFKSWSNIMRADQKTLCSMPGLGIAKYVELQAVYEVGRRCAKEVLMVTDVLKDTQATSRFLLSKMKDYNREVFACLFLNSMNRLLAFQELFYGTVNMTSVHPREVVKAALEWNAVGLIAVHNHPSGHASPSEADIQITKHLKEVLQAVDVRLLDHFIIGKGQEITSFRARGLL